MPVQLKVSIQGMDPGRGAALEALRAIEMGVANVQPALDDIGRMLTMSARKRIEDAEGPDGRPWPALSEVTLERRGRDAQPLQDKRHLFRSLTWRADSSQVAIGSNRAYARIQQLGGQAGRGRKVAIPARPYLGVSDDDRQEITEILRDHMEP